MPRTRRLSSGLLLLVLALTATACAPSLSPLYRDYTVPAEAADDVEARAEAALERAGWTLADAETPNALTTEPRTLTNWGLYSVRVSLEAVPVGDDHVRVFFHPYRYYITGSRSKIPYLKGSLRRSLVPELNEAFTAEGLRVIGTAIEEEAVSGR